MNQSTERARAWAALLVLGGLGIARAVALPPTTGRPLVPCSRWIAVESPNGVRQYRCGVDTIGDALEACGFTGEIRVGDCVVLEEDGSCPARVWQLPAGIRHQLGLKLDINRESPDGLTSVSGIGPRTAENIVAARPFATLSALESVRGIGPVRRRRLSNSLGIAVPDRLWPIVADDP